MTPRRLLFLFLGALTVLRLLTIGQVELSPDEAYYYQWSLRPDISYYSKGPGVMAAIWLGTHLFGANEFGVRVLSPLLALGTSLLMFRFARRLFGESIAVWTVLTLNVIPIFNAGGLLMTIDPLSMFFWMAALLTFWRALERSPEWSGWWPVTGALIGLGFLCKYTNAMQLLSIVLLLLITRKYRRELIRGSFWSLVGVFALFTLPPILWNAQHDWITLAHLSARGGLQKAFRLDLGEFFTFLGAHFGVYSPLIFGAMLVALWQSFDRARAHFKPRFLLVFALPLLAMYFYLSLRQAGEANWTAPAILSLSVLALALWHEAAERPPSARKFALAALAVGLVISLLALDSEMLRRVGIHLAYKMDPSARLRGWRTTAEAVEQFRQRYEAENKQPVFLIAGSYGVAAELAFYLKDARTEGPQHPPVYIPESQAIENQYSFWPRYDETTELPDVARNVLATLEKKGGDPAQCHAVQEALAALPRDSQMPGAKVADARRTLVRALRAARPELPLDEAFVEEQGVNLFAGRTALYITDRAEEKAPSTIKGGFDRDRTQMVACIDIARRGLPLRQIRIFACPGYHGAQL